MQRFAVLAAFVAAVFLTAPAADARQIAFQAYSVPEDGVVVLPIRQGAVMDGPADAVNRATGGALERAMTAAVFTGATGSSLSLYALGGYDHIVLVGIGDGPVDRRVLEDFGGSAAGAIKDGAVDVHVLWSGFETDVAAPGAYIAFGAALGQYAFDKYFLAPPAQAEGQLVLRLADADAAQQLYAAEWAPVAEGVTFARNLINEPGNIVYPESFVERTRQAFRRLRNVDIDVYDEDALDDLGMGALMGVGQGSQRPPRLLVVRYDGGGDGDAPVVFAGKGITFDTGGISIKPSRGMWRMKYDMSGAAAVTGTVLALAKRQARVNAVAIAALAENMPSDRAQRPGDIQRTMSGKTIEVLNTDAEGRLVLADAVWYAQDRFNPRILVDLATLTGSVRIALGDEYAGLFSRHEELAGQMMEAGQQSGELLWRLPLHPSYEEDIKSDVADIKNISGERLAGAGIGAQVIGTFVKPDTVWAHLDIASTAWPANPSPTVPKGGAGFGIRLLDQLVRDHYETR